MPNIVATLMEEHCPNTKPNAYSAFAVVVAWGANFLEQSDNTALSFDQVISRIEEFIDLRLTAKMRRELPGQAVLCHVNLSRPLDGLIAKKLPKFPDFFSIGTVLSEPAEIITNFVVLELTLNRGFTIGDDGLLHAPQPALA